MKIAQLLYIRIVLVVFATTQYCSAADVVYRKVVDTNSALPVAEGPWAGFYNPAISERKVAFLAYRPFNSPLSLFAESSEKEILHVASDGDLIPVDGREISMNFSSTNFPLYNKEHVYWQASLKEGTSFSPAVIEYSHDGLRVAFDSNSINAHAGTTMSWFTGNNLRVGPDDRIVRAFSDQANGNLWLIGYDGISLSTVNENTELAPALAIFTSDHAIYPEGFTLYHSSNDPRLRRIHLGEFLSLDTGLANFVSPNKFFSLEEVFGNGRWLATQVRIQNASNFDLTRAILGWSAGKWFKVAKKGDAAQDGTEITGFSDIGASRYSLDSNSLLFKATTVSGSSLFLFRSGAIHHLLSPGDLIDDQEIAWTLIGPNSLEGNYFTFVAQFTNGIQGVYVGNISSMNSQSTVAFNSQIALNGIHTGVIKTPTQEGKVYHLIESNDLKSTKVIESLQGQNIEQFFTFDNNTKAPQRKFYWVEEVKFE